MRKFFRSFHYAIEGIRFAMKERNMRIHVTCAVLVTIAGLYSQLSSAEWLVLILTMGLVIALEMVNTAIETVVNLVSPEYHALAKAAKDVAAGAVLISAIASIFIGLIIFLPKWFLM